MAEGVAWKFAPLRFFPDRWELSLDNDCILWEMPTAIRRWLQDGDNDLCVLEEDAKRCLGQFATTSAARRPSTPAYGACRPASTWRPRCGRCSNGAPSCSARSWTNRALQAAALSLRKPPLLVSVEEVTICSPFWPHHPHLGPRGAHFSSD